MSATTNPKSLAWQKQREEAQERQVNEDYRFLMSTPQGRRAVYRIVYLECDLESTILGAPSMYLHEREGARAVGATIKKRLQELCPQEAETMVLEASRSQRDDELYRKSARESAAREHDD